MITLLAARLYRKQIESFDAFSGLRQRCEANQIQPGKLRARQACQYGRNRQKRLIVLLAAPWYRKQMNLLGLFRALGKAVRLARFNQANREPGKPVGMAGIDRKD